MKKAGKVLGLAIAIVFLSNMLPAMMVSNQNSQVCNSSRHVPNMGSSDPVGDQWPMFRGELNHTGVGVAGPQVNVGVLWSYATKDWIDGSSPAVVNGRVYVGSHDNNMYCLNSTTGALLWNYTTGNIIDASPAVSNGCVYVGSWDGNVYCLNANTGAYIWNLTTGGAVFSSPAVVGNRVVVGSDDNNVYCLNASTGAVLWKNATGSWVCSSPAVDTGGHVYVGSLDSYIYCLDLTSGNILWSYQTGDAIESSPAVAGGRVYVGSDDNNIYCLNASTGNLIWRNATDGWVRSSPAVANGRVYVGSDDGAVHCLDAVTGNSLWNFTTGNWVYSSPAVVNGCVYVGSGDHLLYCINATTGSEIWNYTTGSFIDSSPAVTNNCVYAGSTDDQIYCLTTLFPPLAPILNPIIPNISNNGTLSFSWTASAGATSYNLYRFTSPITGLNGSVNLVGSFQFPAAQDSGLSNGTYYYVVTAVNASGESSISNCLSASVAILPCPPAAPYLNTITPNSSNTGSITLSWTAPAGATTYKLYRFSSLISGLNGSVTLLGSFQSPSAQDTGLANGTYYYVVTAVNASGESNISNCQSASVSIPPPTGNSNSGSTNSNSNSSSSNGTQNSGGIAGFPVELVVLATAMPVLVVAVKIRKRAKVIFDTRNGK